MRCFFAFLTGLPAVAFASTQSPLFRTDDGGQKPITPPSQYWYEAITHNGEASFMPSSYKSNYKVFANVVTDYGADNTGNRDASGAIQAAIEAGATNGPSRIANQMGTTGQPRVVYLPGGVYQLANRLQLYVGTVLIGDPTNPPILKATATFPNDHIVYGKDPNLQDGTIDFYAAIKNIVIDSTNFPKDNPITLLDWTVSQATQLTNIVFNMPSFSSGHKGLTTQYGYNSNVIMNDLIFNGGVVGMDLSGQQWVLKGMTFNRCTTAIQGGGINVVVINTTFADCGTGIDASGTGGSFTVIDSIGTNVGTLISSYNSGNAQNAIIVENVQNNGNTVVLSGRAVVTGSVTGTWVHGNMYTSGNQNKQYQDGAFVTTPRASRLLVNNKYFTRSPPTYQEFSVDQVINIKSVSGLPVYGNGVNDDTANINAILNQNTSKIIYFPAGTYIVTNTIKIPPGSRIFGDAYASAISATGGNFYNPDSPTAMVQLGKSGDVGVGQISDMLFTVADVLQGCKLLEVNMAGNQPGDVGIWNSHFRVGGAAGTNVRYDHCPGSPDVCKAAWGMLHLTPSSSAYIENMWGWTADHDLDVGGPNPVISVGRGALIEATKGTWLVGTAMEHNTLYQYNYNNAANVASIFQQSETAYWQGPGNDIAPAPWANNLQPSDPTFSNCQPGDAQCGMGFFERIDGCTNLFLYGGCVWAFFNNGQKCSNCQENGIDILNSSSTYIYGTNMRAISTMFRSDGSPIAYQADNQGGFNDGGSGGVVAAYLYNTS